MTLFKRFDRDGDHRLSRGEIDEMMQVVDPLPWGSAIPLWGKGGNLRDRLAPGFPANLPESSRENVDPTAWICEWELLVRVSPVSTIQALNQLGGTDVSSFVEPLPEKVETWKRGETVERSVAQAFLFGAHGVGKSSLLRRFLGSSPAGKYLPDASLKTAVNMVKHGEGAEGSFILTEVNEETENQAMESLAFCDIACLVWDVTRPDSLHYVLRLCERFPRGTKVLLVAMKSDLLRVVGENRGDEG